MSTVVILSAIAGVASIISAITGVVASFSTLWVAPLHPRQSCRPDSALVHSRLGQLAACISCRYRVVIVRTHSIYDTGRLGSKPNLRLKPVLVAAHDRVGNRHSIRLRQDSTSHRNMSDVSHSSLALLGFSCGVLECLWAQPSLRPAGS